MIRHVAGQPKDGLQCCTRCGYPLVVWDDGTEKMVPEGTGWRGPFFFQTGVELVHEGGFIGVAGDAHDVPRCEPLVLEGVDIG